ncbi:unnamed protein product [Rotaria magnacalcarata]|uniref:TLDc domain-containing protein n=1 Tax=Rotaria magnacalcarata TaxID=392030 RepID=A0A8S2Q2Q3_9BILA|nr:unnamed protein product [Rotaria magnacalcarata]
MTSTNFATIHNQITQIKTRFGTLRSDIIEKLNECDACINSAEELYGQVTQMATHLEEKLANVSNEEKEWKETKMKLGTTLVKGIVILNVVEPDRSAKIQQEKKLNEFYGKSNQKWDLIYRGSRDGFDPNAVHTRCDNQGSTMTVVRSTNNYLFGGYASVGWTSVYGAYINDPCVFLFTLTNPHNIPPTKYLVKPDNVVNALQYSNAYGPIFGGCDIALFTNSNSNQSSSVRFPYFYVDTTGQGKNTFTGTANFTTLDIEVFKVF